MEKELWISLKDLAFVFKKGRKTLLYLMLTVMFCTSLYALTNPIRYKSKATFRDKGKSQNSIDQSSLMIAMMTQSSPEGEAVSTFKSRSVIEQVIKKLGLQVDVTPGPVYPGIFSKIYRNIQTEAAYFNSVKEPIFKDFNPIIEIRDVNYSSENKKKIRIQFDDDFHFNNYGTIGEPFSVDGVTFTLHLNGEPPKEAVYLVFQPIAKTIEDITNQLKVEQDKKDKSLIHLEFSSLDRIKSAGILNAILDAYVKYTDQEQKRLNQSQLAYLEGREKESLNKLEGLMDRHAKRVVSDVSSVGFIDTEKAMQFYAGNIEHLQGKLLTIELELKKLKDAVSIGEIVEENLVALIDVPQVGETLKKITELKQLRDTISLALYKKKSDPQAEKERFLVQVDHWDALTHDTVELDRLLVMLDEKGMIEPPENLLERPHLLLGMWQEQLSNSLVALNDSDATNFYHLFDEFHRKKENCKMYIGNLKNFFEVQAATVQEELAHFQESKEGFEGIDLNLANELYVHFHKQIEEIESQKKQFTFLLKEMKREEFELSSLSTVMHDTVGIEIANKAVQLEIAMRDPNHRSGKEQLRIKEDLDLQKNYLMMHLNQTKEVISLREDLLREKLQLLQGATLGIIYRQISFLERQLKEILETKIGALSQEKALYLEEVQKFSYQIGSLPEKWVTEQLVKQQMQINQASVHELTRLVENKNISSSLNISESTPLDIAYPPYLPNPSRLTLFLVLGGFLGFFGGSAYLFFGVIKYGIPVTQENLKLQNQKVAGFITENIDQPLLLDSDLNTLRRVIELSLGEERKSLVVALSSFKNYAPQIATLIRERGLRVLYIDLDFQTIKEGNLLDYLTGKIQKPEIINDVLEGGGMTRSNFELLDTERFKKLLETYQKSYDFIVASIPEKGIAPGIKQLSSNFDSLVVTITDESLQDLDSLLMQNNIIYILKKE
ncbi:Wzz/FepE/Etk N-terminal domain-containing protein [Chlamydiales bacterium]|nr:Wzz/FepE/Etk N-terminal domain-containing protein [Chlamydiales bacterium]